MTYWAFPTRTLVSPERDVFKLAKDDRQWLSSSTHTIHQGQLVRWCSDSNESAEEQIRTKPRTAHLAPAIILALDPKLFVSSEVCHFITAVHFIAVTTCEHGPVSRPPRRRPFCPRLAQSHQSCTMVVGELVVFVISFAGK